MSSLVSENISGCGTDEVNWKYYITVAGGYDLVNVDNTAIFYDNVPLTFTTLTSDLTHVGTYTLEYQVKLTDQAPIVSSNWLDGMTITIVDPCTAVTIQSDLSYAMTSIEIPLDGLFTGYNLGTYTSTKPDLCPVTITSCSHVESTDTTGATHSNDFCNFDDGGGQIFIVNYQAFDSNLQLLAQLPQTIVAPV